MKNMRGIRIKHMSLVIIIFLVLLLIPVLLKSLYVGKVHKGGLIGGYITKNGKPVSGRFMKLYIGTIGDAENEIASIKTDSNGYYHFDPLKPALYFIEMEEAVGDSGYSVGYDAKGNRSVGFTEISFNEKKQTTGIYLAKDQTISDLDYDVNWPGNYQDFPEKYTFHIDEYKGEPIPQQPTSTPTPTAAMPRLLANNTVAIPELGIKMQVPDDMKDLVYNVMYRDQDTVAISFSTTRIINLDKYCGPLHDPVGGIERTTTYHPIGENIGEAKKVGNYYYAITTPQAYCGDSHIENESVLLGKLRAALNNSYKTMQPL